MSPASVQQDVIVVGGGPAGSVLARSLARAGVRVLLLSGPPVAGCEGISRRTRELLEAEALDGALELLHGPVPRSGSWGDRAVTGGEWLVDRALLASALREAARQAGVVVKAGIAVDTAREARGFRVATRAGDCHHATYVVDARGRRGRERRGPPLVAIGQRFTVPRRLEPGTALHAFTDGWCWIATEPGTAWVQLVGAPRRRPLSRWLGHACAELPALREMLAGAEPGGPIVARPAHARLGAVSRVPGRWRVGDAAHAPDPLSGQGIYHALCSARAAAQAIRSALEGGGERPDEEGACGLAQQYLDGVHERMWGRSVAAAASFYRESAAAGPFWERTAGAYAALTPAAAPAAPAVQLRPVLDSGRIRAREVLVTGAHPQGAWHIAGVELAPLLKHYQESAAADVGSAALALSQPPAAVATATRWLQAAGALPPGD
jgi:flavin-dependent dehydrogenase